MTTNPPALALARATLDAYDARHTAIALGKIPATDPAHGARCVRAAEHERLEFECRCCPLHPDHGAMRSAANALCRGTIHYWRQRALVARLEGDADRAAVIDAWLAPPGDADRIADEALRARLGLPGQARPATIAAGVAGNAVEPPIGL